MISITGDATSALLITERIEEEFGLLVEVEALAQGRMILDKALANVHRVTGNLAATGTVDSEIADSIIVVSVTFGGFGIDKDVVYAAFEEDLHPYLEPASHEGSWVAALINAWEWSQ